MKISSSTKIDTPLPVDVIVPNFNRSDDLGRCLRALAAQDYNPVRITVIDNGSTDESRAVVEAQAPAARWIGLSSNRGFGAAINVGVSESNAPWIALLNNDCEPEPGWVTAMVRTITAHPEAGIVASKMVRMDEPSRIDHAGDGMGRWGLPYGIGHMEVDRGQYDAVRSPLGACAGAALYRRSLLDELGGFDEDFFAYQEDMDLSLRARMVGSTCVYAPDALVRHRGSTTMGAFADFTVFHSTRNLLLVLAKNLPTSVLLRLFPYLLAGQVAWFAKMAVKEGRLLPWIRGLIAGLWRAPSVRRRGRALRATSALTSRELIELLEVSGEEIARSVRAKRAERGQTLRPRPRPQEAGVVTESVGGPEPDVSVVIVTFESADVIDRCLDSIRRGAGDLTVEVTVVDNASTDGTVETVRSGFPDVEVLVNPKNVGYGVANNQVVSREGTRGRFVLLLNPDTELLPGSLQDLVSYAEKDSRVGIVGCRLLMSDHRLDLACRRSFPTPLVSLYRMVGLSKGFPNSPRFGRYNLTYEDPEGVYDVDSVVGALMLVRREVWKTIGFFDPEFFLYGEDIDFCFRAKEASFRVVYVGSTVASHLKRASSRKRPLRSCYHFHRAMLVFFDKHFRARYPMWVSWCVRSAVWTRLIATWGLLALIEGPRRVGRLLREQGNSNHGNVDTDRIRSRMDSRRR